MSGRPTMYSPGEIARGGYGPAGTGHPPPPSGPNDRQMPTFELLGKGLENGHAAADRIETVLDRIEPAPSVPNEGMVEPGPPQGHAQNALRMLQHLVSRLHRLAERLESHG